MSVDDAARFRYIRPRHLAGTDYRLNGCITLELENNNIKSMPGCSAPVRGCVIVLAAALVMLIGSLVWMLRMPTVKTMWKCRDNIIAIGAALERYNTVNGKYPAKLSDLKKEYLTDPSVLRCPLDKSEKDATSYTYNRPGPGSPDDFIVLECHRHKISEDLPQTSLRLLKSGRLVTAPVQEEK